MSALGLDKLSKDNLEAFAKMMGMPKFWVGANVSMMAKLVNEHLIGVFSKDIHKFH